jgi:hypothetical protein
MEAGRRAERLLKAGLTGARKVRKACKLQPFNFPGNRNWMGETEN